MRFPWQKKERVPKRRKKRTNPSPLAVARAFADAAKAVEKAAKELRRL